jgi:hypothetical protein
MRREVGIVLVVIYPLSGEFVISYCTTCVCVRVSKPLSGTRRYWRPSEPFVVLVLLDVEELCSSDDD